MIKVQDVIQVKHKVPAWGGCLMVVTEVKEWGVKCVMRLPGKEPTVTHLRLNHGEYNHVGHVTHVNEDMKGETE